MTLHLVAPSPHSETTRAFDVDAFAAKCRRLGSMLTAQGERVVLYGGPANESVVYDFVPLVTRDEQRGWFGDFDPMRDVFNAFDNHHPAWQAFNTRAIAAIRERAEPGDILGLTMGLSHKPIADALPELLAVEMGIGYSGVFAPYRVFESYAWMHFLAGREPSDDVRYFDTVIGNAYDADEFPAGTGSGGYHLFMGRFTARKGIEIAVEATKRLGVRLVIAGPGEDPEVSAWLAQNDGHVERVGSVTGPERATLMGEATALWAPTIYLEPFGSVVTEAMTTGTPVITTDWGAFTETVANGVSGFRCRTLVEFVEAGRAVETLDRTGIRAYALSRYSTAVVGPQYGAYLAKLRTLRGDGWYTEAESDLTRVPVPA
jgi:hypothetical protein